MHPLTLALFVAYSAKHMILQMLTMILVKSTHCNTQRVLNYPLDGYGSFPRESFSCKFRLVYI